MQILYIYVLPFQSILWKWFLNCWTSGNWKLLQVFQPGYSIITVPPTPKMLAVCGEQDLLPALRCPEATGLAKQLVDLRCTGQTVHAHNSGLRRNPVKNTGRFLSDSSHVDRKSKKIWSWSHQDLWQCEDIIARLDPQNVPSCISNTCNYIPQGPQVQMV